MADVKVISDTIQEFNGERFYKCGYYYQHKGKRLHRVVWEYHNGPIPKGYHVHHKDHNRDHNDLDNLEVLEGKEHSKQHSKEPSRIENGKRAIKFAQESAKAWHASEEGRKWHSKHAIETAQKRQFQTYVCTYCGAEFQSKRISYTGNHFCCNNHKAAFRRKRIKDEGIKN